MAIVIMTYVLPLSIRCHSFEFLTGHCLRIYFKTFSLMPAIHSTCHQDSPIKVKVHTLDIEPLRSETPPQKRSGMACVLKGFHSFTCTSTCSSAIRMSHTCLCLPSRSWYSFTDPGGPWCEVARAEIRTRNFPIANPALYHTATSALAQLLPPLLPLLLLLLGFYLTFNQPTFPEITPG